MASNKATELQKDLCSLLTGWNQRAHQHNLPEIRGVWDAHGKIRFTARYLPDAPAKVEELNMPKNPAMESKADLPTRQLLQAALPFLEDPPHAPRLLDQRNGTTRFS